MKTGGGLCPGLHGIGSSSPFPFRPDKLLQRAYPEESGMGVCRSLRGQIRLRHQRGTPSLVSADARRLRSREDRPYRHEVGEPVCAQHGVQPHHHQAA